MNQVDKTLKRVSEKEAIISVISRINPYILRRHKPGMGKEIKGC